jgi:biopolymer transport protein ExbD
MARRKKKGVDDKIEDLNLVPIMNLVVCLIPVVLFGMSLVKIGVVNVNAPKFGMGQAAPSDDEKKPLNLTIAIGEDAFRLTASGADINQVLGLAPAEVAEDPAAAPAAAAGVSIPKKKDEYDYPDLYSKLAKIKDAFPDETIINLTADAKIPVKYVIKVMDAIRYRLVQDTFADVTAFADADLKYEGNVTQLLWPDVVFAVAQ